MAPLDFLKIEVFWKKACNVMIFVHNVTNKILSRASNYILDVVMWQKFGNSSISMRDIMITSILTVFDQNNNFILGLVLVHVRWFSTDTSYGLEIWQQWGKKKKTEN